jgi:3-oxoacyl-[acyl-carrier protein] reductase
VSFSIDLSGHHALITGAGQGIGLAIAHALGQAGARIAVNDVRPAQAEAAVAELAAAGIDAHPVPFDVTDFDAVSAAMAGHADVDVLVNNAGNAGVEGFDHLKDFAESDPSEWERYVAVNLFGVMNCTRAALPPMIASRWGRVITIVSDASRVGNAKLAPYAAAKAGAAGFSRSVAREVGRHAITVNCISLGNVVTPSTAGPPIETEEQEAREREFLKPYVIRRRGAPDDAAGFVAFLCSPHADWVTGQTYPVNGGYSFAL